MEERQGASLHREHRGKLMVAQVAFTMVGTVIGAGFASGQEILRFFVVFGHGGVLGLLLCGVMFMALSRAILVNAARLQTGSHRDLLAKTTPAVVAHALDALLVLFLLVSTAIMLAGAGAVIEQHLRLNFWLGTLLMAVAVVATAAQASTGVLRLNLVLAPLFVLAFVALGYLSLAQAVESGTWSLWMGRPASYTPNWWVAALIYPSYNMFLSISGLSSIGGTLSPAQAHKGAWFGSIAVSVLLVCVAFVIWAAGPDVANLPIPTLAVADLVHPWFGFGYLLAILAAMLTTASVNVYGMARRLAEGNNYNHLSLVLLIVLGALPLSRLGFVQVVGTAYPAIGYGSLVFFFYWLLSLRRGKMPA